MDERDQKFDLLKYVIQSIFCQHFEWMLLNLIGTVLISWEQASFDRHYCTLKEKHLRDLDVISRLCNVDVTSPSSPVLVACRKYRLRYLDRIHGPTMVRFQPVEDPLRYLTGYLLMYCFPMDILDVYRTYSKIYGRCHGERYRLIVDKDGRLDRRLVLATFVLLTVLC